MRARCRAQASQDFSNTMERPRLSALVQASCKGLRRGSSKKLGLLLALHDVLPGAKLAELSRKRYVVEVLQPRAMAVHVPLVSVACEVRGRAVIDAGLSAPATVPCRHAAGPVDKGDGGGPQAAQHHAQHCKSTHKCQEADQCHLPRGIEASLHLAERKGTGEG